MSCNKEVWAFTVYPAADNRRIFSGITANVSHHHIALLDLETQHFTEAQPQFLSVNVSAHRAHRAMLGKTVNYQWAANVAGVPNFIAVGKMQHIPVVPAAVCVGEDSNAFHHEKRLAMNCFRNSTVPSIPRRERFTHKS